jgi:hypothetical protein
MADFLKKIQKLPERRRKFIFWSIIIVIGLIFFVFWIKNSQKKLGALQKESFQLPSLGEELNKLPKTELPGIGSDELKKLEKEIEEASTTNTASTSSTSSESQ